MDAGAPGERNDQHGEPRRSLEGLDCLGMLAGNASEHASSVRQAQGQRRGEIGIAPPPASSRNETSPAWGLEERVVSVVVDRQAVQHLRIGIRAIEKLRDQGVDQLHSRKLRSFAEVAFQ